MNLASLMLWKFVIELHLLMILLVWHWKTTRIAVFHCYCLTEHTKFVLILVAIAAFVFRWCMDPAGAWIVLSFFLIDFIRYIWWNYLNFYKPWLIMIIQDYSILNTFCIQEIGPKCVYRFHRYIVKPCQKCNAHMLKRNLSLKNGSNIWQCSS